MEVGLKPQQVFGPICDILYGGFRSYIAGRIGESSLASLFYLPATEYLNNQFRAILE